MAANPAPQALQVKVREKATGRVFLKWPVDARELVSHPLGEYEYAPDEAITNGASAAPPVTPPKDPPTIEQQLGEWSYKDVQVLAKRAGLKVVGTKKDALIEALLPHVKGGTVSLEQLPKLVIDPVQFPHATVAE